MAVVLWATTNGRQQLSPDGVRQRIREESEVIWEWPIIPDGEEPKGDNRRWPRQWKLLRTLGAAELAEKLSKKPAGNTDAQRKGVSTVERGEERGHNKADKALIRLAVNNLDAKNAAVWTQQGKPQVEAVRVEVERLGAEETGHANYPAWLKRDLIEAASGRRRAEA